MPLETLTVGKLSVCSLTDGNNFTLHEMLHKTNVSKCVFFKLDEDVFLEMVIFMLACSSKEKKHPSW